VVSSSSRLLSVGQGEHELAAAGRLATDGGAHFAAAHGAAGHGDLDSQVERVARQHYALEPHLVDAGEKANLAGRRPRGRSGRGIRRAAQGQTTLEEVLRVAGIEKP